MDDTPVCERRGNDTKATMSIARMGETSVKEGRDGRDVIIR